MEETVLICGDSQADIFTAIYRAYEWKLNLEQTFLQIGEEETLRLFARYITVEQDSLRAERTARTILTRLGEDTYEQICYALSAPDSQRAQAVFRTVAAGFSGLIKGPLMQCLTNPDIHKVFSLARGASNEAHHLLGFLRFREISGKVLLAEYTPKNNITDLIMPHFADRFPNEDFLIYDRIRGISGVHPAGKEWFLVHGELSASVTARMTDEEKEMQNLFQHFVKKIEVKDRHNPKLQKNLLPLRFRSDMTEFSRSSH